MRTAMLALILPASAVARAGMDPTSIASIIGALPEDDQAGPLALATQARVAHADANPDKHAQLSAGKAVGVIGERDLTPAEAHHQLEFKAHREDLPKPAQPQVAVVETAAEQKLVA